MSYNKNSNAREEAIVTMNSLRSCIIHQSGDAAISRHISKLNLMGFNKIHIGALLQAYQREALEHGLQN